MLIRPEIAALRGNSAPQRAAQVAMIGAMDRWRDGAAPVFSALEAYGSGAPLEQCPALARLFGGADDGETSQHFARGFTGAMLAALTDQPLGHIALRYNTNAVTTTLILGQAGRATLALTATDGAGLARAKQPRTVSFAPNEVHDLVLAGGGTALLYGHAGGALTRREHPLAPGDLLTRDGREQALVIARADGLLVFLKLQRARADAAAHPVRVVDLASGAVRHRAAAASADSRREMMVALLGRMGRADAAPRLAEMARAPGDGADNLRWQALRECLGLDSAADPADPLAAHAGALRAQLIEAHPRLASVAPCPV